jgi:hypothetical protein
LRGARHRWALPVFSWRRVPPGGLAGIRIAAFGLAGGGVVRRRRDVDGLVRAGRGGLTDRWLVVDGLARIAFVVLHGDAMEIREMVEPIGIEPTTS